MQVFLASCHPWWQGNPRLDLCAQEQKKTDTQIHIETEGGRECALGRVPSMGRWSTCKVKLFKLTVKKEKQLRLCPLHVARVATCIIC